MMSSPAGGGAAGIGTVRVNPGSASFATSYSARLRYKVGAGGYIGWGPWRSVDEGVMQNFGACMFDSTGAVFDPQLEVRAENAAGYSYLTVTASKTTGASGCS